MSEEIEKLIFDECGNSMEYRVDALIEKVNEIIEFINSRSYFKTHIEP